MIRILPHVKFVLFPGPALIQRPGRDQYFHVIAAHRVTLTALYRSSTWSRTHLRMLRRRFSQVLSTHLQDRRAQTSHQSVACVLNRPRCLGILVTCNSVLGLGTGSCMYITPNNGSGAPSASSRRDRASAASTAGLRVKGRPGGETTGFLREVKLKMCEQPLTLTCCLHPCRFSGRFSVWSAGPQRSEVPLEGHESYCLLVCRTEGKCNDIISRPVLF